jgi:hypothetical protein
MTEATLPLVKRAWVRWAAAAIVLVAGYAELWVGSQTVAPVLLTVGYCILVPFAILA